MAGAPLAVAKADILVYGPVAIFVYHAKSIPEAGMDEAALDARTEEVSADRDGS